MSYDAWCKSLGCELQKLMFSHESLDSYKNLSQVGPIGYEDFYSRLKTTFAKHVYEQFLKMFKENGCTAMGDWLLVYNTADVVLFIEAFRKMAIQYYTDKIDCVKTQIDSISGISMTSVLQKSLEKDRKL